MIAMSDVAMAMEVVRALKAIWIFGARVAHKSEICVSSHLFSSRISNVLRRMWPPLESFLVLVAILEDKSNGVAVVKGKRVETAALRVTYGHLSRPEIPTIRLPSLPNHAGLGGVYSCPSPLNVFADLSLDTIPIVCATTTDNKELTSNGGFVNDEKFERQTVTPQHVRRNQSFDRAPRRQEEHNLNSGVDHDYRTL